MSRVRSFFQTYSFSAFASLTLLILRIIVGIAFMHHGWMKIQSPFTWMGPEAPVPAFLQFLAALSEFGGGLALIIGLLTPLAMFGLACTMAVATHMHAIIRKDPFVMTGQGGAYELPLVYLGIALVFMALGPGRYSLDALIFGKK